MNIASATTDRPAKRPFGISIVIPNYNGEKLLQDNLSSVFNAIDDWGGPVEVIIVDDCSSDNSCTFIRTHFPTALLLVNKQNSGFSKTCNIGVAATKFSILLCINTDVRVEIGLLKILAAHFGDPELFAVTPRVIVDREQKNQGVVFARFSNGVIKGTFAASKQEIAARETLYAVGACVAYDAEKFIALGGYGEIYSPYLFEDVDISYRAWKRGWKSIYDPSATVWHYSNATLGKIKRRTNKVIYYRNRFIFHWINLSDPSKLALHVANTLLRLAFNVLWFNFVYYEAFWGAAKKWHSVFELRRHEKTFRRLRDADVIRRTARNASP